MVSETECGVLKTRRLFENEGFWKQWRKITSYGRFLSQTEHLSKMADNVVMFHACEIQGVTRWIGLYLSFHLCTTHLLSPSLRQHNCMLLFLSLFFPVHVARSLKVMVWIMLNGKHFNSLNDSLFLNFFKTYHFSKNCYHRFVLPFTTGFTCCLLPSRAFFGSFLW